MPAIYVAVRWMQSLPPPTPDQGYRRHAHQELPTLSVSNELFYLLNACCRRRTENRKAHEFVHSALLS